MWLDVLEYLLSRIINELRFGHSEMNVIRCDNCKHFHNSYCKGNLASVRNSKQIRTCKKKKKKLGQKNTQHA